jgi:phospholipid/cholesterol/gamma-HCH transport system permease protein
LTNFFETLAGMFVFSMRFLKEMFIPPYEIPEIRKHMIELGMKTLPIVGVTGFIIGLVMTMQLQPVLQRFGAEAFLPGSIGITIVRELGPVITALIFAGRVSSGIGAELGSMRVTEQIDAMEVSGVNPFRFLVVTRVFATTFILPILTVYVIFIALIGGYIAVVLVQNMTWQYYVDRVVFAVEFADAIPGVMKTFVFGFIVGIVGAYLGYNAKNGTEGVGRASTTSVVAASLLILIFDMVLVKLTLWLWPAVK